MRTATGMVFSEHPQHPSYSPKEIKIQNPLFTNSNNNMLIPCHRWYTIIGYFKNHMNRITDFCILWNFNVDFFVTSMFQF